MSVKVKICGITNLGDAVCAVEAGADAIGFVFYEKSPRYINPKTAGLISREMPPFVTSVGVFVNDPPEKVMEISAEAGLDCVQLHGDETPEYCSALNIKVIKALRIKDRSDINKLRAFSASAYLLDTFREGVPGGTGETFDWAIALEAKKIGRIILSGGLTPENVAEAISLVGPYAVDVSSGVEKRPGQKDPGKILKFMERVRRHAENA